MKNFFLLITIIIIGFVSYYRENIMKYYNKEILGIEIKEIDESTSTGIVEKEKNKEIKNKKIDKKKAKSKIDTLRKRYALRGLIISGDLHFENSRLALALQKYLEAYKQNPNDELTIKKIGDTYFEMKKYDSAYKNFKSIINSNVLDKEKVLLSYLYSTEINSNNIEEVLKEIDLFGFNEEENFFYKNSIKCLSDYHVCKLDFGNYFTNFPDIKSEKLIGVKKAIKNYKDFKVDEVYYKNFLVLGELFKAKLYPISIKLGKDLLLEKEDYKNVIKIIGKSYFELGKYELAKEFFQKFYELDKKDSDVTYLLGVTHIKLHDYLLASINLKNTIELGYENPINVKRRLIYAYYELGETERMLKEFQNLVETEEPNLDIEDLSLAIYYHIINEKNLLAKKYAKLGIKLFPLEGIFYGYLGWMEKDAGNIEIAEKNLRKGLKLDRHNPLILLNLGQIELKKGNPVKSIIYFKKTIKIDKGQVFGENAKKWLEKANKIILEEKKAKEKEKTIIKENKNSDNEING
ncbi:hypothetical protein CSB07_00720 [Candidatus Gracilibacteria bacterium]|nr:MAG: hypothetical protein CSB07_00720 [Candidatus Gracilibacteria bacterium]PIE85025.1 MAG: hypothetical protein CSA08_04255 [Candidatus Gracilibacteria bacterium]